MTRNRWRSVDAYFHDGTGRVLQSVLPIKAAKNTFMTDCSLSEGWFPRTHDQNWLTLRWRSFSWWGKEGFTISFAYKAPKNTFMTDYNLWEEWFPRTHDHKSLTLRWCLFSWWGSEGIAICFAYKGRQKYLYDWLQPMGGVISRDAWQQIVDALLMLIFIIGQGRYCNLFCL